MYGAANARPSLVQGPLPLNTQYDYLGRMLTASYYDLTDANVASSDQKFREEVTYPCVFWGRGPTTKLGNLATLKRNGLYLSGASWTVGQIDNLTLPSLRGRGPARWVTSGTNRLATVTDAAPVTAAKALGFKAGSGAGYTYDANGNLKTDSYKGLTATDYNFLNLLSKLTLGSKTVTITYDATGRKLKVTAGGTTAFCGAGAPTNKLRVTPKGSGWPYYPT